MISYPCRFSNSLQIMEYSYLLDMADQCEDPFVKLAYACKPYGILSILLQFEDESVRPLVTSTNIPPLRNS